MYQPVADEGIIGRVQERPGVGRHDHAVAALLEVAGIDQDADHAKRGALVEGELLGDLRGRPRLVKQRLDQADLECRHEDDLRLPLAREEIDAGHHVSLFGCRSCDPLRTQRVRFAGHLPDRGSGEPTSAGDRGAQPLGKSAPAGLVIECLLVRP